MSGHPDNKIFSEGLELVVRLSQQALDDTDDANGPQSQQDATLLAEMKKALGEAAVCAFVENPDSLAKTEGARKLFENLQELRKKNKFSKEATPIGSAPVSPGGQNVRNRQFRFQQLDAWLEALRIFAGDRPASMAAAEPEQTVERSLLTTAVPLDQEPLQQVRLSAQALEFNATQQRKADVRQFLKVLLPNDRYQAINFLIAFKQKKHAEKQDGQKSKSSKSIQILFAKYLIFYVIAAQDCSLKVIFEKAKNILTTLAGNYPSLIQQVTIFGEIEHSFLSQTLDDQFAHRQFTRRELKFLRDLFLENEQHSENEFFKDVTASNYFTSLAKQNQDTTIKSYHEHFCRKMTELITAKVKRAQQLAAANSANNATTVFASARSVKDSIARWGCSVVIDEDQEARFKAALTC